MLSCEELKDITQQVISKGIDSLSNEQVRDLLVSNLWSHDSVCDCGHCMIVHEEELW